MLYMVTWISSLLLVAAAVGTGYSLYRMAPKPPVEIIAGVNGYALVGGLVFVVVACALTLGVYTIIHTHRMLGSAYHIGMHLNRMNAGNAPPALTLREGDYFREIADEINTLQARGLPAPTSPPAPTAPAPPPSAPPT